jgi:nucleotide-binding universal stress UspA family protein
MKIKKILIGIDDSIYARNAAAYGFDIARSGNAAVGLVHIIEPAAYPVDSNDSITSLSVDPMLAMQQADMTDLQTEQSAVVIENIIKEFAGELHVTTFTEFDITADGIIRCAKQFGADMIVVGTHKRSGLDRLFIGNIAADVVKNSDIPVLVVPFAEE